MKRLDLHRILLTFALVLGMVIASSPAADTKDLTMVNKTGADIIVMNCSPSISDSWYNDVLGDEIWPNGTTITLDFDRWMLSDTWDFKVHYGDGTSDSWYDVDVRHVNTIILHKDGTNEYL